MKYVRIVKYFMHGEIILNAITSEEIVRPRDTTKRYYKEIGVSSSGGGDFVRERDLKIVI